MSSPDLATIALDGPSPEQQIAKDMVKRAVPFAPVVIGVAAIFWGTNGALSAAYGIALICLNFLISAAMLAYAARISLAFLMAAALGGFLVRLGLLFLAVYLVKDSSWVVMMPLGLTIIFTHLGLLAWETRYISMSLAYPGLKPEVTGGDEESSTELHQ